jgi:hypothetical protein
MSLEGYAILITVAFLALCTLAIIIRPRRRHK